LYCTAAILAVKLNPARPKRVNGPRDDLTRFWELPLSGLKRVAPFMLFGPVSGPLLAGVVFNLRDGRPILAGLYAIALAEAVIFIPAITAKLSLNLLH
jgi:hypothetical protein